jgi:hypothetical protein
MIKRYILLLVAIGLFVMNGICQSQKPSFSSNPSLSFEQYISGVKYAEIALNALNQEKVDKQIGIAGFYNLAQKYLLEMGFEYVALTSAEKTELNIEIQSYCECTKVMFGGDINKNSISNSTVSFISCNGDLFSFTSDKKFNYGKFSDIEKKLVEDWQSIINTKSKYNVSNQLQLPSNPTAWTKDKIQQYLVQNKGKLAPIEGIYERVRLSFEDITGGKYTVGIIKNPGEEGYLMVYLAGAKNAMDWKKGEIKAMLNNTATKGFYSVSWISRDKSLFEDVYCNIDQLGFQIYSSGIVPISYRFIKIFPINE